MQVINIPLFVFRSRLDDGTPAYQVRQWDYKSDNELRVGETSVSVTIADEKELAPAEVQLIDRIILKVRQDAEDKIRAAIDLKGKLLSLTM